jgi:large subunit ribosomal protein L25
MDQITLRADAGRQTGTRPSRRLRRQGRVPATIYGQGIGAINVAVDQRELHSALTTDAGFNALINLEVGKDTHLAVAREVQRHPVRGEITHLDFIKISLDVAIEAEVGIEFIGIPVGVTDDNGIVETLHTSVMVSSLPAAIPSHIPAHIEELGVGDTYTVAMLAPIEGVEILSDPDMPLATIVIPALLVVEEPEAAAEEAEGAEAAEGAEEAEGAAEAAETEDEA